jgi:protocatechuate 3,4-dioxygenase beta subunit
MPEHDPKHDPDEGLHRDLRTLALRRRLVVVGGAVVAAGGLWAALRGRGLSETRATGAAADGSTCMQLPAETAGPFPADGTNRTGGEVANVLTRSGVERADLRQSFDGMTAMAEGVVLDLTLSLVSVAAACAPLAGHAVYLWHCDAEGAYSIYERPDRNYLRGLGITDAAGRVSFTTAFPGCYRGRWPHVHVQVFAGRAEAVSGRAALLTSQYALPEDACRAVYAMPAYVGSGANLDKLVLTRDGVFWGSSAEQLEAQTFVVGGSAAAGLTATATLGLG